jgi:hypothetical protein
MLVEQYTLSISGDEVSLPVRLELLFWVTSGFSDSKISRLKTLRCHILELLHITHFDAAAGYESFHLYNLDSPHFLQITIPQSNRTRSINRYTHWLHDLWLYIFFILRWLLVSRILEEARVWSAVCCSVRIAGVVDDHQVEDILGSL